MIEYGKAAVVIAFGEREKTTAMDKGGREAHINCGSLRSS